MPTGKHNSPKPKKVLPKVAQKFAEELEKNSDIDNSIIIEPIKEKKPRKRNPGSGRPPITINKTIFENLCKILCTIQEIESVLEHDIEEISGWCFREYGKFFPDVYKHFSAGGKASLRRNQFNLSKSNAAMGIWLGKQWLGQRDEITVDKEKLGILIKGSIDFLKNG